MCALSPKKKFNSFWASYKTVHYPYKACKQAPVIIWAVQLSTQILRWGLLLLLLIAAANADVTSCAFLPLDASCHTKAKTSLSWSSSECSSSRGANVSWKTSRRDVKKKEVFIWGILGKSFTFCMSAERYVTSSSQWSACCLYFVLETVVFCSCSCWFIQISQSFSRLGWRVCDYYGNRHTSHKFLLLFLRKKCSFELLLFCMNCNSLSDACCCSRYALHWLLHHLERAYGDSDLQ